MQYNKFKKDVVGENDTILISGWGGGGGLLLASDVPGVLGIFLILFHPPYDVSAQYYISNFQKKKKSHVGWITSQGGLYNAPVQTLHI